MVVRETGKSRAGRSNATTPRHQSRAHPAACCLMPTAFKLRLESVQDVLDRYTRSHSQPGVTTPQLELVRHEAVSGLRKMPPCAAKSRTSPCGFTPVNTMTHTATGSGSSCIHVERAVKVGMLFTTPHSLGRVSLQVHSSSVYLSLNYISRMENSQIT